MAQKKTLKQKVGALLIQKLPVTKENIDRIRFELNCYCANVNNKLTPWQYKKFVDSELTDLSINVGTGPFGKAGWVNVDMFKFKNYRPGI